MLPISRLDEMKPYPERPSCDIRLCENVLLRLLVIVAMPESSDPVEPRHSLFEQFDLLADELGTKRGQPRDIAARLRQASDEAARNRIGRTSEDDGNEAGRLLGG